MNAGTRKEMVIKEIEMSKELLVLIEKYDAELTHGQLLGVLQVHVLGFYQHVATNK